MGAVTVAKLLRQAGYSLQANRKTREGASHPDRNAQFEYINASVRRFLRRGQPAISVDTKKKELVGDFKNGGREWRPRGTPEEVRVHDFLIKNWQGDSLWRLRHAAQSGLGQRRDRPRHGPVRGQQHSPLVERDGAKRFPQAKDLLITADGGGSNSHRSRLWKVSLQELADELGLRLSVCHFPPGTSKWNKIEHRLFSFITQNWRGKPLVSHQTIVNLIAGTTTRPA